MKPALTPEEWAAFPNWPDAPRPMFNGDAPLYHPTKHGIAAANLHGQPFGFSREDVGLLRSDVHEMVNQRTMTDPDEARILDLAARIEALLPPEVK